MSNSLRNKPMMLNSLTDAVNCKITWWSMYIEIYSAGRLIIDMRSSTITSSLDSWLFKQTFILLIVAKGTRDINFECLPQENIYLLF